MSLGAATLSGFSPARVGAMVARYLYLLRSSWPRLVELVYWPAVQMLTWGFLQTYIRAQAGASGVSGPMAVAGGTLIGSLLLWDTLFRGQLGFSMSFLEEMWSRNIANLLMSPLRPLEFVAALMTMSIVRLAIGLVPVTLLALWFFGFNLWGLGFALGRVLRQSGADRAGRSGWPSPAWCCATAWQPKGWPGRSCFSSCRSPASTIRSRPCRMSLQIVAWRLPPTYVFEGLRGRRSSAMNCAPI